MDAPKAWMAPDTNWWTSLMENWNEIHAGQQEEDEVQQNWWYEQEELSAMEVFGEDEE